MKTKEFGNIYRRRVIEAMTFFAKKVKRPNKTLMYRMLAELDFRHFSETGLPVTNLVWTAFSGGPVPANLDEEIPAEEYVDLPQDFSEALACSRIAWVNASREKTFRYVFKSKRNAKLDVFSPRQIRILGEVAEIFKQSTRARASQVSHTPDAPWTKTVALKGEGAQIEFIETVKLPESIKREEVQKMLYERSALIENFA